MSDVLDDIVTDAAEAIAKPRRRSGEKNPMVYALSNGLGLVAVRLCIFLMFIVVSVGAWTGNYVLHDIRDHITGIHDALKELRQLVDGQGAAINDLKVDVATVKQSQADRDAKR